MQVTSEPSPPAATTASVSEAASENPADQAGVGVLLQSALGTANATFALARAESRLAYRSMWRAVLIAASIFLLALTGWWLLCTVIVVAAHTIGLPWLWSLILLLVLHAIAIFFLVRYFHELLASVGFVRTRAQLAAIASALNADKP